MGAFILQNTDLQSIDTASRSTRVEQSLLQLLSSGKLPVGARLPTEMELAQSFGVSRVTVREAITRLRADGLVSTKAGRGAVVESLSPASLRLDRGDPQHDVRHLFELRAMVEVEAAGLAAERHTRATLEPIKAAHAAMASAAKERKHVPDADVAFHQAIAAATANPHVQSLMQFLSGRLAPQIAQSWLNSAGLVGGSMPAYREHAVLLKAIIRGDAQAAREAARAHLDAAQRRLQPGGV